MPFLLPADCLNEVFENLEDDKVTIHSCLLVNRLWCEVSVRILWRNIWSHCRSCRSGNLLDTLISCLPNESKELLRKNEIFISTPSKPLLFNYVAFCKVLSIYGVYVMVQSIVSDTPIISINSKDRSYSLTLITEEILKMFMNHIFPLKKLNCFHYIYNNISFTHSPGARDCLTDLSELRCYSDFCIQLSHICYNLQSISIIFSVGKVSDELIKLISLQKNLKFLELSAYYSDYRRDRCKNWADIIPALTKHTDSLTKLHLYIDGDIIPLSLVSLFLNLQEIKITMHRQPEEFKVLHVTFLQLQTLKIYVKYSGIKPEHMTKFLEINGKNLRVFHLEEETYVVNSEENSNAGNNAINLSIVKFCPNLKKLYVTFNNGELDMLKTIFDSCQYLEGIAIRCGGKFLNDKEVFETVAKHSPKNFYELELRHPNLVPEDLESFFISWNNRALKKSLSLIFYDDYSPSSVKEKSMKIIKKYKNLGIIIKFEDIEYDGDLSIDML